MRCHQVLTGACNANTDCFAVGTVLGVPFTVYATGCDLVFLDQSFDRIQIVPGINHDRVQISCVDCSADCGRVAAAYGARVCVFGPVTQVDDDSLPAAQLVAGASGGCGGPPSPLKARWVLSGTIEADCAVHNLSWNMDGGNLLTGGEFLQMWVRSLVEDDVDDVEEDGSRRVRFAVGDDARGSEDQTPHQPQQQQHVMQCNWRVRTAEPVHFMAFSRDGALFATAGLGDKIVKVWYEKRQLGSKASSGRDDGLSGHAAASSGSTSYDFIYLAHPLPVTGLQWRHTSKFMLPGVVANMLVTSCRDNICRVWVETTRFTDDCMTDGMMWPSAASRDTRFPGSKHHKHKFLLKLKHMRHRFHMRRSLKPFPPGSADGRPRLPGSQMSLHSDDSVIGGWRTDHPALHFHLAATINAECDIPLVPSMGTSEHSSGTNFMVHWLNNKEMTYTSGMERLMRELDVHEQQQAAADNDSPQGGGSSEGAVSPSQPTSISGHSSSNALETPGVTGFPNADDLENRLTALLKDWEHGSDLIFSIHPVDGSFLVWTIDHLDEHHPSFRQAQVSFSSRIPQAFPLGDAMTMSTRLCLFACGPTAAGVSLESYPAAGDPPPPVDPVPAMSMVSKHTNGSLNLWTITFGQESRYKAVLNVAHGRRVCGHRFRVNDITCHPVLPLMLSTSHHNRQHGGGPPATPAAGGSSGSHSPSDGTTPHRFNKTYSSELILWRVDPVGPLSKLGGVTELTRVNVPEMSAFSHVAWIPTLLPSTTLGSICNSPSTCFVASDGRNLNLYQAVIDARSLLAEINNAARKINRAGSGLSVSTDNSSVHDQLKTHTSVQETFECLISQQSAARPGCVIHLDTIPDVTHDWEHTQFLHVYQEQLITGRAGPGGPGSCGTGVGGGSSDPTAPAAPSGGTAAGAGVTSRGPLDPSFSAIVDLHQTETFAEPFYIVVVERDTLGTMIHMWRVVFSSQPLSGDGSCGSPDGQPSSLLKPVSISTTKVCTQHLPLPEGVEVTSATPAAGHLSSASIYPACFAPYHIVTACSDNTIRFWKCRVSETSTSVRSYRWCEWEMMNSTGGGSALELPGRPLTVSVAYSGRVACAYKKGQSFVKKGHQQSGRFVNIGVVIHECESTGGSEWVTEDTINLHNVPLPRLYTASDHTLSVIESVGRRFVLKGFSQSLPEADQPSSLDVQPLTMRTAPSFITDSSVKSAISEEGNVPISVTHKHLVHIDWVSSEDGAHMLTLGVGNKILMFTRVSSDITVANMKAMKENQLKSRPMLQKASSIALPSFTPDQIRWMKIRQVKLESADGLPPLPMQMSWVRDGVLIVGMDNEMHVYSQWQMPPLHLSGVGVQRDMTDSLTDEYVQSRNLTDQQLFSYASDSMKKRIMSVASVANLDLLKSRSAAGGAGGTAGNPPPDYMPNYGLFEAARIAFPVLPQYHPKQLMELLNCGKVKRVKAILAHIVRYVRSLSRQSNRLDAAGLPDSGGGMDDFAGDPMEYRTRSRGMSISLQPGSPLDRQATDDGRLDYEEVDSVPPLPLWMLLVADKSRAGDAAPGQPQESETYDDLFKVDSDEATLEDIIGSTTPRKRLKSMAPGTAAAESTGLSQFGPRESRILTQMLTHCHLPDLTSIDQLYLMALADTVASIDTDLSDRFSGRSEDDPDIDRAHTGPNLDSIDDCGLRYVLAMKNFIYLSRCLPPKERSGLNSQGLTSSYVVWGFHSDSGEELLQMIPSVGRREPLWSELQQLGVGWWLRSNSQLLRLIEQVAKTAYQKSKDPMDAALYYIAMRKKTVIAALYKQLRDSRKQQFFSRDFSRPENRIAAKKNAYQLLGKQNFRPAAALFLLADSLDDCVEVILTKLKDLQLAMVVCRLYDGQLDNCPESLRKLLNKEILGIGSDGVYEPAEAHPDPFLRSMAYWTLKDNANSLNTLLRTNVGSLHAASCCEDDEQGYYGSSPSVFNFYVYLRTHPLIVKRYKTQGAAAASSSALNGRKTTTTDDKQFFHVTAISPLERQLYFGTAHAHYRSGCPTLALEVLSKLPDKVLETTPDTESAVTSPVKPTSQDNRIQSGTIDWSQPVGSTSADVSDAPSFGVGGVGGGLAVMGGADTPRATSPVPQSLGQEYDWSTPVRPRLAAEPLELTWDDDRAASDSSSDNGAGQRTELLGGDARTTSSAGGDAATAESDGAGRGGVVVDIMSQQLKYIACLQLMMEELSNLATGLEVDGGQLRYHLYLWLEREVQALMEICNYDGGSTHGGPLPTTVDEEVSSPSPLPGGRRPTLHDVLLTDKMDFEAKLQRATRRKAWLKANQSLLRTLLSYCSLQGAGGGALASVRMELILLLQELQQESSRQQLLSPLPFPTMIPLLSASVANNKTVVMDPVRHLQAVAHDLLHVVSQQVAAPVPGKVDDSALALLKNTAVALSCCVYQALCDSDAFKVKQNDGVVGYSVDGIVSITSSHLTAGLASRLRRPSAEEPSVVTSVPGKWPGVTSLRALMAREKDEDGPNLTVLLTEVFVAVYVSLLVTAVTCCDSRLLYRLVRLRIDTKLWSSVFGGGVKKLLRVSTNAFTPSTPPISEAGGEPSLMTSLNKQRARFNMKLLGPRVPGSPAAAAGAPGAAGGSTVAGGGRDDHATYREQFIPPETSIVQLMLSKPSVDVALNSDDNSAFDFDSDTESLVGESDEGLPGDERMSVSTEHSDPDSYSWRLIRFACIKLCRQKIVHLLAVAGIEQLELPIASPLIHAVLGLMDCWVHQLESRLNTCRPPQDYVSGLNVDESARPPIVKYRSMMLPYNTPFDSDLPGVRAVKRLWLTLVRQEAVQDTFVRALFSRRSCQLSAAAAVLPPGSSTASHHELDAAEQLQVEPIKIIHKDQDAITAFCINQVNSNQIVLATHKDLQELDISLLVNAPDWLECDTDFDTLHLNKDAESMPSSNYLVVQTAGEGLGGSLPGPATHSGPGSAASSAMASPTYSQSSRGPSMILRHRVEGVRRLSSHPNVPVYITGSHDGSVTVREWAADCAVATARPSGTYAKANRVRFNYHGNKFGVADNDGNLSLWQMSLTAQNGRPFYTHECHSKFCSDFVFVGSSSLLATAGLGADNRNVCLWDTLLPSRKSQVSSFTCHDSGASALIYSPSQQVLISGGKRGDVCIFDLRRRQVRHRIVAHDNSVIKSMCLDPAEEYLVTGSDEGDVKVFSMVNVSRDPVVTYRAEHARGGFFKNVGHGVTQVHVDKAGRLYSCGADGSIKLRSLPFLTNSVVSTVY